MQNNKALIAALCLAASLLVVAAGIYGGAWSTYVMYVDLVNGRTRSQEIAFGFSLKHTPPKDTDFTRLVKLYHLEQVPVWKVGVLSQRGLRRMFFPQEVTTNAGRDFFALKYLAVLAELNEVDDLPKAISEVRKLALTKNGFDAARYVSDIHSKFLRLDDRSNSDTLNN